MIIATILNFGSNLWSALFVIKNLDTTPPLNERVTKNERDILGAINDRLEIKKTFVEAKDENKEQFKAILFEIKELRKEYLEDRLKAARTEPTIERFKEHLDKPEVHEYKRYIRKPK